MRNLSCASFEQAQADVLNAGRALSGQVSVGLTPGSAKCGFRDRQFTAPLRNAPREPSGRTTGTPSSSAARRTKPDSQA
jgi:hypothetical protein